MNNQQEQQVLNKITHINTLKSEISDLNYFTKHISGNDCSGRFSGFILRIRELVKIRIFGSFYFGCGRHEKEITIPNSMNEEIHHIAIEHLKAKTEELNSLIR